MVLTLLRKLFLYIILGSFQLTHPILGHDPIFSPGPHVLFKEGIELHLGFNQSDTGNQMEKEQAVAIKYGITGDWVAGVEIPYQTTKSALDTDSGLGDLVISTKYRFMRIDTPGVQESASILLKIKLNTANQIGTNTTDSIFGLTYGYESLKWYRWASVRYRFNQNNGVLARGDRWFIDIAGGYRAQLNDYREADTVWLLELNAEFAGKSSINRIDIDNSGGEQLFISPGVMWTYRNFAIKTGVQIPVLSRLGGTQSATDYRLRLEFELHL